MPGAHPELAPIAFLSALSLFLPLPWHWRNGNIATLSIIGWLFVVNIIYGVDAVLWADDVITRIPVWCDITTKLIIGSTTALPSAGLCVCVRLYKACAARGKPADTNPRNVRIWEFVACYVVPCVFMALHYIVQGHRFDIIETLGCRPALYFSIPGIFIVLAPPIFISLLALVYGVLSLIQIHRHYHSFISSRNSLGSHGNLSLAHYIRLMILALTQIFWVTTVSTLCLVFNLSQSQVQTYDSWEDVHEKWLAVWSLPLMLIRPSAYRLLYLTWYIIPISTLIFVSVFAFGEDAICEYRRCFQWLKRTVLPRQWRKDESTTLAPLEFNRPEPSTAGTYTINLDSKISPASSFASLDNTVDIEKAPVASGQGLQS